MSSFTLTWRAADGTETPLDGSTGILVTRGPVGFDLPTPTLTIDNFVSADGAAFISQRRGPRLLAFPMFLRATRVQSLVAQLFTMFARPGTLIWSDSTNTRELRGVVYEGGLGGDLSVPASPSWRRIGPAQMLALDPWWYGAEESQTLSIAAPTAFNAAVAFSAAIPFNGGASASVAVTGDVDAYPVITVYGPADEVTVGCGGLEWQTDVVLSSGDVMTIDARPGSRGPRLNGGGVDWSLLTESSRLWPLPADTTSVVVGTVGSTGATAVSMTWEPRYATP